MSLCAIRILLAAIGDEPQSLVEERLEQANAVNRAENAGVIFYVENVSSRGIEILRRAAHADVVLFGLEDGVLPGEASHIVASYPDVKIIGVDDHAKVRIVLGAVAEPLSHDLPSVICWITRRREAQTAADWRDA